MGMVPSLPWEVVKIKIYTGHETVNLGSSRYSENGILIFLHRQKV